MSKYKKGLLVKAVDNINDDRNVLLINEIKPDLIIVAGTRKLKKEIYNTAKKGAINLHSGILPFYRGGDSEFWALFNNEPDMVGVSIHFIDEDLDSGDVIFSQKQTVRPSDSYSCLRQKNIRLGAVKINEILNKIESGACQAKEQDDSAAKTYKSATKQDIENFKNKRKDWLNRSSCKKIFGNNGVFIEEEVASAPLITYMQGQEVDFPRTFCLRIDADEYDAATFGGFLSLFKKYRDVITIFINANSFQKAKDRIKACKDLNLDIQSHGFYHHIYADYKSNRYNINKAKTFFNDLGITTKGFAAPMGRWNRSLIGALEDEGYCYSSDFSYDYMGLPSYPSLEGRISGVLEIPIFPISPESFFLKGYSDVENIYNYYKNAIDELERCAIPVMIYAHTSSYSQIPMLLEKIIEYAVLEKKLKPINMTEFYDCWSDKTNRLKKLPIVKKLVKVPEAHLMGKQINFNFNAALKGYVKKVVDFERITPDNELFCPLPRKIIKKTLRKVL